MIQEDAINSKFKEDLKDDGKNTINHRPLYKVELARDFENLVLKAAREV